MKTPPRRHWRSYGNEPLPTGPEALGEPLAAFRSWLLRIECDRCGKVQMVNEAHAALWRDRSLRAILDRMRHDGCGGRAGKAELLTGIDGVSSRPVRKIVLLGALLATVLGLSIATPAAAADAPYLIGMGWSSCGAWTANRTARNVTAAADEQWVVGYLSGVAIWTPGLNPMNGVDADAVWAWMDNYCRAHPLVAIKDATSAFVRERMR